MTVLFADLVGFTSRAESLDPEDVVGSSRRTTRTCAASSSGSAAPSRSSSATRSWRCSARRSRTRTTPSAPCARRSRSATGRATSRATSQVRIGRQHGRGARHARRAAGGGERHGRRRRRQHGRAAPGRGARQRRPRRRDDLPRDRATRSSTRRRRPSRRRGRREPVPVWEAVERPREHRRRRAPPRARAARRPGPRARLLLRDALARARQSASPQLVTLVGVPGIGKCRLVHELLARWSSEDEELIAWRQGRSLPYGEGVTFWALGEMVKAQAGMLESDDAAAAAEKLRRAVADLVEDPGEAELGRAVACARWSASAARRRPRAPRGRVRGLAAVLRGARGAARRLVLVFEDLHWADDGLLDFVDHLVDWVDGVPLLVVGTARPELLERRPGWGGGKRERVHALARPADGRRDGALLGVLLERSVLEAEHAAGAPRARRREPAVRGAVRADARRARRAATCRCRRRSRASSRRGSTGSSRRRRRCSRTRRSGQGLLERDASRSISAASTASRSRTASTRSSGKRVRPAGAAPSVAERDASTRSATCWCATSPTARSRARAAPRSTEPRARGSSRSRRREDHAEMLAHHYLQALELARAAGQPVESLERAARYALRDAGDRALSLSTPERRRDGEAVLRGRSRAVADGRRRAAGAPAPVRAQPARRRDARRRRPRRGTGRPARARGRGGRGGGRGAPRRRRPDPGRPRRGRPSPRAGARARPAPRPSRSGPTC